MGFEHLVNAEWVTTCGGRALAAGRLVTSEVPPPPTEQVQALLESENLGAWKRIDWVPGVGAALEKAQRLRRPVFVAFSVRELGKTNAPHV